MSGKLQPTTNKYTSFDETVTYDQGVVPRPFLITHLLDIIRNDGPDEVAITLDGGDPIPLLAGDYIGPWDGFFCSTITIQCIIPGGHARVRGNGI